MKDNEGATAEDSLRILYRACGLLHGDAMEDDCIK